MSVQLAPSPKFQGVGFGGLPVPGGKLYTYIAGTTTPQVTYVDSTQTTQNSNPVILDANAQANVWLDVSLTYKVKLTDFFGNQIYVVDQIPGGFLTQANLGPLVWPKLQSETNAGISVNTLIAYGDMRRYGLVANNSSAATTNGQLIQALFDPIIANGPIGDFFFTNTTGADIYYFDARYIQIRDGARINLNQCTLNFSGAYTPTFNGFPFLSCIRDVTIENGNINVNYIATAGSGAGAVIQIGNRYNGIPWGIYTLGILDQDDLFAHGLPLQGNCTLRNLRITSNNPGAITLVFLGDISNTLLENIWIDCQNAGFGGIDGEFGFASVNGNPGTASLWTSSHAQNLQFKNIHIDNVLTGATNAGIGYRGAWSLTVEGLYVNGADVGAAFGGGEAFYYRPWIRDTSGPLAKPFVQLRDINLLNVGVGITLQGAANGSTGSYLSPVLSALVPPASYLAFTDLISLFVDGFSINSPEGIDILGAALFDIRNGSIIATAGTSSGGIILSQEAVLGAIENVRISGIAGEGIRADFGSAIWSPVRNKMVEIRRCKVIQCNSTGIGVSNAGRVLIENNILGSSIEYDGVLDTVQSAAVQIASGTSNVTCDSNYVSVALGGTAYFIGGSTSGNCNLKNPMGTSSTSGNWDSDNIANRTGTQMAAKTDVVNTIGKYTGKQCQNSSINKLFIAQGAVNTSNWISVDGVTTITPS